MPPLEFGTCNQETKRWSKAGSVEIGNVHTLFNFRSGDGKQEMIMLQCDDETSVIKTADLGEKSLVQPGRMQVLHPESPKEMPG